MIKKTLALTFYSSVFLVLSGCVSGPTRADVDQFFVISDGRISPKHVREFADCLLDGFDKAHFILTNISHRQQRRTDSYRVESLAGGHTITISADVFDDGRVVLNESKTAALISTSGQKETFNICLTKFGLK